MFQFKLEGNIHQLEKKVTLTTEVGDIQFGDKYLMKECQMNLFIDYSEPENPQLDIYISGDFVAEI